MRRFAVLFLVFAVVFVGFEAQGVSASARAAAVINADTGEALWTKNATERLPMASTTKIMTALLLCESGRLSHKIVVTEKMVRVEGSSMGLLPGDSVSLRDLLYGLMLASGNDAANTVAIVLGGSTEGFADMMNKRAEELGLKDTHFVTPSGLDSKGHYTTAIDLAILAAEALKNPDFAAAVRSKTATLCYGNPPYKRTLTNHNRLLKMYDDVIGVKTGFTKRSGRCLVSAAERDGRRVIAVTLNDPDDWADHRALLDYGLSKIECVTVTPDNSTAPDVIGASGKPIIKIDSKTFGVSSNERLSARTVLPQCVFAPVKKGELLGAVHYMNEDKILATERIVAKSGISAERPSLVSRMTAVFKVILKNAV